MRDIEKYVRTSLIGGPYTQRNVDEWVESQDIKDWEAMGMAIKRVYAEAPGHFVAGFVCRDYTPTPEPAELLEYDEVAL